jgi:hypothetical protein
VASLSRSTVRAEKSNRPRRATQSAQADSDESA